MHHRQGRLIMSPTIFVHDKSCLGATKVLPEVLRTYSYPPRHPYFGQYCNHADASYSSTSHLLRSYSRTFFFFFFFLR